MLVSFFVSALFTFGVRALFNWHVPVYWSLAVYLATLYGCVWRVKKRALQQHPEPDPDYPDRPISGPFERFGRFGQLGSLVFWNLTTFLGILNPLQACQILRQLVGTSELQTREKKSGDDGSGYETRASYALPFTGEWYVFNGGLTPKTSHSWDILGHRFALDFVQADSELRRHTGLGTSPDQYYCYGAEILAAADGTIISSENRIGIAPLLGWFICDFTARSVFGNYVLIQHAEGEYALYAHLIKGSVTVELGHLVKRGEVIGRCGHTGNSTEPHLHFHLQDSADLFSGMGLPIRFTELVVDGEEVNGVHLKAGNRVQCRDSA